MWVEKIDEMVVTQLRIRDFEIEDSAGIFYMWITEKTLHFFQKTLKLVECDKYKLWIF